MARVPVTLFALTMLVPTESAPGNWIGVHIWSMTISDLHIYSRRLEIERPDVSYTFRVVLGKSFNFSNYLHL